MDEAIRANRVIIMNDGEIAVDGDAESIFRDVEGLHRMGLEAPQGSELIFELRKLGIDIKQCGHGEDEAIDALYNLLQGQKI